MRRAGAKCIFRDKKTSDQLSKLDYITDIIENSVLHKDQTSKAEFVGLFSTCQPKMMEYERKLFCQGCFKMLENTSSEENMVSVT